jgi:hypothetical protein
MNTRIVSTVLFLGMLSSCDKARSLVEKAGNTVKQEVEEKIASGVIFNQTTAQGADPELAKLVDETSEGVIFQKDLPFPSKTRVSLTSRDESSYRLTQTSPLEGPDGLNQGMRGSSALIELDGDQLRYTAMKSPPLEETNSAKKKNPEDEPALVPEGPPLIFRKSGDRWTADFSSGFRAMAMIKQLAPQFDEMLSDHALIPRPLWFTSKKRFKVGDTLTVSGESLAILMSGKANGTLQLKLEAFEPVHGHPCAVFSYNGNYKRRGVPDFDGNLTDEDVTVESGKLWFSLIHPLLLKEEINGVRTFTIGGGSSAKTRGQGALKIQRTFKWNSTSP